MSPFAGSAVHAATERFAVGDETVTATRVGPTRASGPRPALLVYTPYHREVTLYGGMEPLVRSLAARGYEVVVADMVGTGGASGCKDDPDAADEGAEAGAVLTALADREWCDGRLGMFGLSYSATTSIKGAAARPDLVDAIVPVHGPHTAYRDAHVAGRFALYRMGGDWLPYMTLTRALPPLTRDPGWAAVWGRRLDCLSEGRPWLFKYLDHQTRDEFWAGKDVDPADVAAATLAVCGWRDTYAASTIEYYRGVTGPKRLLLGPWRHVMPHRGRESAIDFRDRVGKWFDRHLRGEAAAVDDWPAVTYWTERDGGGRVDGGEWRGRRTWPEADAGDDVTHFALSGAGLVPAGEFTGPTFERTRPYDQTVGMTSVEGVYVETEPMDTAADDARSIAVETDPLAEPLEYTGTGRVDLRVSASTPSPLVVVRVVDVAPDGRSSLVSTGVSRLDPAGDDGADGSGDADGAGDALSVTLTPRSHVFEAGHRVRLAVSAAFFPLALPPREQGSLTLASSPPAPSTLSLPGGAVPDEGFRDTVAVAGPDRSTPTAPPRVRSEPGTWWTAREHLGNRGRVETKSARTIDLPDATVTFRSTVEADVAAADPSTATVSADLRASVDYGDEVVTARTESRVDAETAHLRAVVTHDDHAVLDRTWRRP